MAAIKASISFGLVYIPVQLQNCVKENNISFNLIDKKTNSRIRYIKTCEDCGGKSVDSKDIVKGYEYEDGKYVLFEDKDFEKLKTAKDKSITISCFSELSEIEPVYFNKPYYVQPAGGEKAFSLLYNAMHTQNKVAIARFVFSSKESLVALRAKDGEILLYTLHYHSEITKNIFKGKLEEVSEKEQKLADSILLNMTEKFIPENYQDEYSQRVLKAIEEKVSGKEIKAAKDAPNKKVTSLMDALELSLKATLKGASEKKKKPPVKAAPKPKAQKKVKNA